MPPLELIAAEIFEPAFESVGDFMDAGGPVVLCIFGVAVLMWTFVLERLWWFTRSFPRARRAAVAAWEVRADKRSWHAHRIRAAMISELRVAMSARLPLIRVIVPLCPLLGLLGTVLGMLHVFDIMALKGSADARTMAYGVSQAMISTLAGLIVSLVALYFANRFQARVRREEDRFTDLLE